MILDKIDEKHLLLQGLTECKISDPEETLRKMRSTFPEIQIQLMRADRIGGREHLEFAAKNAVRAFSQRQRRTRNLAVELLLYASCQRQISKAIQILGLKSNTTEVVVAALSDKTIPSDLIDKATEALRGLPDDGVLDITSKKKATNLANVYGVTRLELEASKLPREHEHSVLKRLIIERSALLAIQD